MSYNINNNKIGIKFESSLKRMLKNNGINAYLLAIPEIADLVVLSKDKHRLIECKVVHDKIFYLKNHKQYDRLLEYANEGISVYYAINFIYKRISTIKFFYVKDSKLPYKIENGYSFNDFIKHIKNDRCYE